MSSDIVIAFCDPSSVSYRIFRAQLVVAVIPREGITVTQLIYLHYN